MTKKIKKEITEDKVEANGTPVQSAAWLEFLAKYEKANPVKFAKKKANGEFDIVPAKFR